jgi:acyl-CoA reductase-like NAD-dependent aldehyde dehydrogenase
LQLVIQLFLKPARSTPLSVLELAKIIDKTSLPKGAISILPTDREARKYPGDG